MPEKEKPIMDINKTSGQKIKVDLFTSEWQLVQFLRKLGWGTLEITVQNSTPIVIKQSFKTIRLI